MLRHAHSRRGNHFSCFFGSSCPSYVEETLLGSSGTAKIWRSINLKPVDTYAVFNRKFSHVTEDWDSAEPQVGYHSSVPPPPLWAAASQPQPSPGGCIWEENKKNMTRDCTQNAIGPLYGRGRTLIWRGLGSNQSPRFLERRPVTDSCCLCLPVDLVRFVSVQGFV